MLECVRETNPSTRQAGRWESSAECGCATRRIDARPTVELADRTQRYAAREAVGIGVATRRIPAGDRVVVAGATQRYAAREAVGIVVATRRIPARDRVVVASWRISARDASGGATWWNAAR
jgi:hypothetical protein